MPSHLGKISIGYSDFIKLCRVENPEDWIPGLRVAFNGVWVKVPSEEDLSWGPEHAELSKHPDGDPSKPVLTFPCTVEDVRHRVWDFYGGGFIDPFELATFALSKSAEGKENVSKASEAQTNRRKQERQNLLRVAFAVLWHFPPEKQQAVSLARRIEEKAGIFWPETGDPPVQRRKLTDLIAEAIELPDK